jgi:DNA/RNA-binding domain of Phe-tRNA-synthetase-like protein
MKMNNILSNISTTTIATLSVAVVLSGNLPQATATSLIQKDLFFGRNIAGGGEVSETEFEQFIDNTITPRFPDGLTVFDADGQFKDSTGTIIEEQSKVVTLLLEDTPESDRKITEIVRSYTQQFNQESVLQVTNENELKVGFGAGENLIDSDLNPELIEVDLFFGRNIPGGGEVSKAEFEQFIDSTITPRFPDGLTVFDADGQFKDSTGTIIEEQSQVVTLLLEDTPENESEIDEIIQSYIEQFNQESVLLTVNEEIAVGFGAGENLIDSDVNPELITADLFFGRNIPGGGEVSEAELAEFIERTITPRFPDGVTVYDADGQFKDSTGTIIEEQSKVVTLILEDTPENEIAIDEIIQSYTEQFNQESVLLTVDEDVEVAFEASSKTSIPEPSSILALFALGTLAVKRVLK